MKRNLVVTSLSAALMVSALSPVASVQVEASSVRAATITLGDKHLENGKLVLPKTYQSEKIYWYKSGFNAKLINKPQLIKGYTVKSKRPVSIMITVDTISLGNTYAYGGNLVLPKTYESEPVRWYKSGFNAKLINKPQLIKGYTVKTKRPVSIMVTVDNYPISFTTSMVKVDVEKGETVQLPSRLKAKFANGGTYFVDVRWGAVDTSTEGAQVVTGTYTRNKTTITVKAQVMVKPMTTFKMNIMHTNDTHGRVEAFPKRVTAIKAYRATHPDALLLDAGDVFSGTLYFNEYNGLIDAKLMNYAGYDLMTLGNHEFDLGGDADGHLELYNFIKVLKTPIVSSNVDFSQDTLLSSLFKDQIAQDARGGKIYKTYVKEVNGQKIGFIGLTTEDTKYISSPGSVQFLNYIESAQAAVDSLEEQGINKIVALSHIGYNDDPKVDNDLLLAKHVDGLDVIIGGHSHDELKKPIVVNADASPTVIVQASEYGKRLGTLEVEFDKKGELIVAFEEVDGGLTLVKPFGELIDLGGELAEDAGAKKIIAPYKSQIDKIMKEEIGAVATEALSIYDENDVRLVRKQETGIGNLIADGMLSKAKTLDPAVVAAFTNGGGIRASIDAGPITVGEVITTLPFGNTLATVSLTGEEVIEVLERSVEAVPVENGAFLSIAGMKYEYDSSKPAKSRVTKVEFNENGTFVALDPAKTYKLATNAYTAKGGDNFKTLEGAYAEGRVTDLGLSDWENFRDHLRSLENVTPVVEGRVVDINVTP